MTMILTDRAELSEGAIHPTIDAHRLDDLGLTVATVRDALGQAR